MVTASQPTAFANLAGHQFMKLTTYRKTGQAVPTPVWFAQQGDKLYVITQEDSGKVKRIRHTSRVVVEPCTARGESLGPALEARARELNADEGKLANKALNRKYGVQKVLFDLMGRMSRSKRTYLEISLV
jgi:hypothetical protein